MTSLRRLQMAAVAAALLLMASAVTWAALLGVSPGVPTTVFALPGTTTYNAGTQTFTVTATPVFEAFAAPIGTKAIATPRGLTINIQVDSTGALVGGVAGNDLTLTGSIDTNGDGVYEYSNVLLTGEVLAFGSQNVSTTDVYDFRFSVTGGALQTLYGTNDVGIRLTSQASMFTGSFRTSFSGRANGTIGPIAPLVTNTGRIGDFIWQDTNGNGVQDGDESGIDGVTIGLLDSGGNTVATTTAGVGPGGQHGYYQFTGLAAGSYTVVVGAGLPVGFTPTPATAGADGSIDSNGHPSASVTLPTSSSSDQTIDFGYLPPEGMIVVGWGQNTYGQTGSPKDLASVSAGAYHNLGLKSDGTVAGWGRDYYGQATPPAGLSGVVAVAAGAYHSVALKSNGTVVAWGNNEANQLNIPAGLSGVTAICGGLNHSLALKVDGTVVGWGWNNYGQASPPSGLTNVAAVACGAGYSMALKKDGTVIGWGANYDGQATPPVGLTNVVAIAAGWSHALALKADGTVVAWGGMNTYGEATPPADLTNVVAIAGGGNHSLALKSDGTVVGWGRNDDGQATPPAGLANVVAIAAGGGHSLARVAAR